MSNKEFSHKGLPLVVLGSAALLLIGTSRAQAQYRLLHSFIGADGDGPTGSLVRDSSGNLYGTAFQGGNHDSVCATTCGVIFKIDAAGTETTLYKFCSKPHCVDGANPWAGVILDSGGNLYGTTTAGGARNLGVVFKLDVTGRETVLHAFSGPDGASAWWGVIRDAGGNLYGTTASGGASNAGVVFKLDLQGRETVLYQFTGLADGGGPQGLVRDAGGNLYGPAASGGAGLCGGFACGVIFKLDPAGTETVLHDFTGTDGQRPNGGLFRDSAGNLYGTTLEGGAAGIGVVFKLDANGLYGVLHNFMPTASDGGYPQAGVIQDSAGNLYGTADSGGLGGYGVVFKLDPAGNETILHNFKWPDGANPYSSLIRDSSGILYGTTAAGGTSGIGVVFALKP